MQYCRSLNFPQQPDYEYLIELFNKMLKKLDADTISIDWSLLKKVKFIEEDNCFRRKKLKKFLRKS
jgi:hypothetical protein